MGWQDDFDGASRGPSFVYCNIRQKDVLSPDRKTVLRSAGGLAFNDPERDDLTSINPVIILFSQRGRAKWNKDNSENPDCKSINFITPVEPVYVNLCDECPYPRWHGKEKPECGEILQFLCVDTDYEPYIMQFKSTGLNPTKDFLRDLTHRCEEESRAPWHYVIELTTKLIEKNGYSWFIPLWPDVSTLEVFTDEEIMCIEDARAEIEGSWRGFLTYNTPPALRPGTPQAALPEIVQ